MKIALRFIRDKSILSEAIQFRTDGIPSHVEFLDLDTMITLGSRLKGGIAHRPYSYTTPFWEEIYSYDGIEAAYEQALTFVGRKYDWADIVWLAVGKHPKSYDPERAICSCFCGYSDRRAFVLEEKPKPLLNFNLPTWAMTPQILYGAVTDQLPQPGGIRARRHQ